MGGGGGGGGEIDREREKERKRETETDRQTNRERIEEERHNDTGRHHTIRDNWNPDSTAHGSPTGKKNVEQGGHNCLMQVDLKLPYIRDLTIALIRNIIVC